MGINFMGSSVYLFFYVLIKNLVIYYRFYDNRVGIPVFLFWVAVAYFMIMTGGIALDVSVKALGSVDVNMAPVRGILLVGLDMLSTGLVANKIKVNSIEAVISSEFFRGGAFMLLLLAVVLIMQIYFWGRVFLINW
jgi:hypothetical protein